MYRLYVFHYLELLILLLFPRLAKILKYLIKRLLNYILNSSDQINELFYF